jgi:hypothetical protein
MVVCLEKQNCLFQAASEKVVEAEKRYAASSNAYLTVNVACSIEGQRNVAF